MTVKLFQYKTFCSSDVSDVSKKFITCLNDLNNKELNIKVTK